MRDKQPMLLLRHTLSLFGKRHAGALRRCDDDHLDTISSSPRRPFVSLLHRLCSFLTVSVGSATLSASDVRAPLSNMWSERQGCSRCQPAQLSAALVTVDLAAGATPLLFVNQQQRSSLSLPKICFGICVSKDHFSLWAVSQLTMLIMKKSGWCKNFVWRSSIYTHTENPHWDTEGSEIIQTCSLTRYSVASSSYKNWCRRKETEQSGWLSIHLW